MWLVYLTFLTPCMSVVQDHDCLVEGPLDNMQPSLMSFPPPLNRRTDQRRLYFTALSQGTHAGASSQVRGSTNSELGWSGAQSCVVLLRCFHGACLSIDGFCFCCIFREFLQAGRRTLDILMSCSKVSKPCFAFRWYGCLRPCG